MLKLIQWFKMKKQLILLLLIFTYFSFFQTEARAKQILEYQDRFLSSYDKFNKNDLTRKLVIDFNTGVLKLNEKKYKEAIKIFRKTAIVLRVSSVLNIAISYYNLKHSSRAKLFFRYIYKYPHLKQTNTYAYMSASFYLYKITKDDKYLEDILRTYSMIKQINNRSKSVVVDALILLKRYSKALKVLDTIKENNFLKKAMLRIKLRQYPKARQELNTLYKGTFSRKRLDKILWIKLFLDLKENNFKNFSLDIDTLRPRLKYFKANLALPFKIYYNTNKYSAKYYLKNLLRFNQNRTIDFIFYFAPFIFSDNDQNIYDFSKGFIFKEKKNEKALKYMLKYNASLINTMESDPIIRVEKLRKIIKHKHTSYMYYNLGLACAQVFDFYSAYKYFHNAYKLNPGNKLFAMMSLLSAKRIHLETYDIKEIRKGILNKNGLYKYFGYSLYGLFYRLPKQYKVKRFSKYEDSLFAKAILFIKDMQNKKDLKKTALLKEEFKDPLVYLLALIQKPKKLSNFSYYSSLQAKIPLKFNKNFIEGSFFVSQVYFDVLKSLGLLDKADIKNPRDLKPSYVRIRAILALFNDRPKEAFALIRYLKRKYDFNTRLSKYILVSSMLSEKDFSHASIEISLIQAQYSDTDAGFLTGIQLLQELKLTSLMQNFVYPYRNNLIDFKLIGFDKLLESL